MQHENEDVHLFIPRDSARGRRLVAQDKIEDDDRESIIVGQPDLPSEQYSRFQNTFPAGEQFSVF